MSNPQSLVLTLPPQGLKHDSPQVHDVLVWEITGPQPLKDDWLYCFNASDAPQGIWSRWRVRQLGMQTPTGTWSVEVEVESVRGNCLDGLLPLPLLYNALPDAPWLSPPPAFVLSAEDGLALKTLWNESAGQHSLLQYVRWSQENEYESYPGWLADYRETTALAARIRQQPELLDKAALDRLWRIPTNGVASVASGAMPHDEFDRNLPLLRELTLKLAASPDHSCYLALDQAWRMALEQKLVAKLRPAVVARLFAAFRPDTLTTTINSNDCTNLLKKLGQYFELRESPSGDWYQLNESISRCMRQASLPDELALENNIAVWRLLQTVQEMEKEIRAVTEDRPSPAAASAKAITSFPSNQILYGPPGTGKTYETIYAALQILDPAAAADYQQVNDDKTASLDERLAAREKLKASFDKLSNEQRVRFVTFHQSFSYEDFVEGLRAETVNGQLHYRVEAGVFKQICEDASATPEQVSMDTLLDTFIEQVAETPEMLSTATGKQFLVSYSEGNATLTCEPQASKTAISLPANIEHVRALLAGKPVDKLYCASYVKGIAEHIRKQLPSTAANLVATAAGLPHVLIIDEINRGNISRIFGELITLIEPSKRAGASEALSVTLPYSKDNFSVPDNVYLIGTMNTADRSLAGLDLALRRRFSFTEMPPRPDLLDGVVVDGVNIGQMLRVMNQRITVLLDRDHTLGHAYFMPLQQEPTLARLAAIFRQAILPLLQEYFFEDWERIRWVLNDHRKPDSAAFIVEDKSLALQALFGDVHNKLCQTTKWKLNPEAFAKADAYRGIAANLGLLASVQSAAEEAID